MDVTFAPTYGLGIPVCVVKESLFPRGACHVWRETIITINRNDRWSIWLRTRTITEEKQSFQSMRKTGTSWKGWWRQFNSISRHHIPFKTFPKFSFFLFIFPSSISAVFSLCSRLVVQSDTLFTPANLETVVAVGCYRFEYPQRTLIRLHFAPHRTQRSQGRVPPCGITRGA
jgi:hypothetical protein